MRTYLTETKLHWIFRLAVAAEFIGHGAFGVLTKAAWVPYFGVAGIGEPAAYKLMPLVGLVDVTLGLITLFSPRRVILAYLSFWGLWTALLRPLSGEPIWETLERAGNFGVPLAFLLLSGWPARLKDWFTPIEIRPLSRERAAKLALVLRLTTGLLLIGHGCLAALSQKAVFARQGAALGLASVTTIVQDLGWVEIALGVAVLFQVPAGVLLFIAAWKILSESLYPLTGDPAWEFVERGASYAAPLALYLLQEWVLPASRTQNRAVRMASAGRSS